MSPLQRRRPGRVRGKDRRQPARGGHDDGIEPAGLLLDVDSPRSLAGDAEGRPRTASLSGRYPGVRRPALRSRAPIAIAIAWRRPARVADAMPHARATSLWLVPAMQGTQVALVAHVVLKSAKGECRCPTNTIRHASTRATHAPAPAITARPLACARTASPTSANAFASTSTAPRPAASPPRTWLAAASSHLMRVRCAPTYATRAQRSASATTWSTAANAQRRAGTVPTSAGGCAAPRRRNRRRAGRAARPPDEPVRGSSRARGMQSARGVSTCAGRR